jgi:hypothetical protein
MAAGTLKRGPSSGRATTMKTPTRMAMLKPQI